MNAIVGFSSLLSEPDIDSSTRHSYIDIIMNSSNHLLSIITDIIDISNIEANIVKITKSGVNLNSVIKSLYEQFLLKANEKKITMISEPGLPDKESIILTDKTKLIQIISNLLNNAFKFTQQGQVKFGYAVKDKLIEFFVSDTGLGIPEEQHQRIFDRFYQVENPVLKLYEGIGLGLAICNAYVELLGGEIRLSSTSGTGSTFYFTLPFEKPAGTVITTSSPMKETGFVFPVKKKILVAEDNDNNFKLIGYFLFGANVEIIRASNGNDAVEKCLSDQSIDLVLMDIRMPGMNGYTATDLIRLSKPDIPIIAQTAYADDRERAIECGCSGIISKPFDKKGLLKVIREFI
jgi:CheY-like chemotaxis protein